MNDLFKARTCLIAVAIMAIATLEGCGTLTGAGIGAAVDRDKPLRGALIGGALGAAVDHAAYERGQQSYRGGGRGWQPCDPTLNTMMASEGLIGWASVGGQGTTRRSAQANGYDSGGGAGYSCNATNAGSSTLMGGQVVPQMGQQRYDDRPWLDQGSPQYQYGGRGRPGFEPYEYHKRHGDHNRSNQQWRR